MMRAQFFDIMLTVRAPVLCAGLERKAWGWDVSFIRNEESRPIIPRDHIKGHVRQAMELLAARATVLEDALLEDWLGRASPDGSNDEPRPGRVIFDDLVLENGAEDAGTYTRIRIDADSGTVKKGMLAFFEQIAPPGAELTFRGTLTLLADDEEAEAFADILSKALNLIPAVGAMKSAGFGEVVEAQAERREGASRANIGAAVLPEKADSVTLEVTFDRPILVNAVHEADNLMVSSEVVPGGVIKGALAWLLGQEGRLDDLSDALSNIIISHAFPLDSSGGAELAHPVPLCMASFKRDDGYRFRCDLGLGGAGVVENGAAPFYPPDWKRDVFEQARKRLGQPSGETLARLQRTRVAIDYDSGAAEESQLFTEVAISERISGKRDEKRRWRFTVHRNNADERAFRALLERIREGLFNIGRTNAAMTVAEAYSAASAAEEDFVATPFDGEEDTFALMLLTPAVMTDALALGESGEWVKDAREAYAEYWAQALPGAELVDFMASQRWAGRYLGIRFRSYGKDTYYPFMLTESGSVFLLKGAAREDVERLLRTHLPHAPLNGTVPNWRASPFVPENGYGRVRCLTRAEIEGERDV